MRALIFDFDGLILDTETPEFHVWTQVFEEHGVRMPDGYWSQVIGRGAEQEIERPAALLARLTGTYVESEAAHLERRRRIVALIEHEEIRPGIEKLLDDAEQEGMAMGVASSSKHEWVDKYLKKVGLFDRFSVVVCADDVERAKPFPDLYLKACQLLGVAPNEAVALEDSPNGVAAAKAAGLFTVTIPNSVTAVLDLSLADLRIDDLPQVGLAGIRGAFLQDG